VPLFTAPWSVGEIWFWHGGERRRPGWYPHRYGNEEMQSNWDGEQWTGASRLRPPVVSFKPVLLILIRVAIGGAFLGLTALFGDAFIGGVVVVVMVTGLFFPGVKTYRGMGGYLFAAV